MTTSSEHAPKSSEESQGSCSSIGSISDAIPTNSREGLRIQRCLTAFAGDTAGLLIKFLTHTALPPHLLRKTGSLDRSTIRFAYPYSPPRMSGTTGMYTSEY